MKTIGKTLLLLALIFAGCNKKSDEVADAYSDTLLVPSAKYLTNQQLQAQVDKEIRGILELANDARISDAIQIISLTEEAVKYILDSSYSEAIGKLEDAIGKASVMTAARPELNFFPLDVQVTTRDLVADIDVLIDVRKQADRLTDKGYLQAARHLLNDLASELEIKTPMLPIATYPSALTMAAKALEEEKPEEALIYLNTALSTVFVETKYVPLPLIRAERMLEEVSSMLEQEDQGTDIYTLLENAESQIRFAEVLGYGKKDQEFEELYRAIKELRKEMKKEGDGDSKNQTTRLRQKLSVFKDRLTDDSKSDSVEE
jgi:hypothetical protein